LFNPSRARKFASAFASGNCPQDECRLFCKWCEPKAEILLDGHRAAFATHDGDHLTNLIEWIGFGRLKLRMTQHCRTLMPGVLAEAFAGEL